MSINRRNFLKGFLLGAGVALTGFLRAVPQRINRRLKLL